MRNRCVPISCPSRSATSSSLETQAVGPDGKTLYNKKNSVLIEDRVNLRTDLKLMKTCEN